MKTITEFSGTVLREAAASAAPIVQPSRQLKTARSRRPKRLLLNRQRTRRGREAPAETEAAAPAEAEAAPEAPAEAELRRPKARHLRSRGARRGRSGSVRAGGRSRSAG